MYEYVAVAQAMDGDVAGGEATIVKFGKLQRKVAYCKMASALALIGNTTAAINLVGTSTNDARERCMRLVKAAEYVCKMPDKTMTHRRPASELAALLPVQESR